MITVREATISDVEGISAVFQAVYSDQYIHPQYYDTEALARLVYGDDSVLLVAIEDETGRVAGSASVVFSVGAYNDLVGEFGRLVVHPDYRGRGIGNQLMEARLKFVSPRLHVGLVENRAAHTFSQQISRKFGFVPVGFLPMKMLMFGQRESIAVFMKHFGDALELRRNHPRIIPEASRLAGIAMENCGLPQDAIIDETSVAYPYDDEFELDELQTEGYTSLLRIQRGRLENREVFGPVRLHYGLFQLQARHSHYLIARRNGQTAGGIGYMHDTVDKVVRIFELISVGEQPIRFLLSSLLQRCREELDVAYIDLDVSAYSPRMQRTLLELGFLPTSYVPANVFHEVERLDVIKMTNILVPFELGDVHLCEEMEPIAAAVMRSFAGKKVAPRIAEASQRTRLFAGLTDEQRQRLLSICTARTFQPGEELYRVGERGDAMHLILSGQVELVDDAASIGCVTAGQCVGETALLSDATAQRVHSVTAIARSPVEVGVFPTGDFRELIRRRPDIGVVVYRNLAIDVSTKLRRSGGLPD